MIDIRLGFVMMKHLLLTLLGIILYTVSFSVFFSRFRKLRKCRDLIGLELESVLFPSVSSDFLGFFFSATAVSLNALPKRFESRKDQ